MSTLASATDESYLVRFWDIASYTGGEPTAVAETSWGRSRGICKIVPATKQTKR